MQITDLDFTQVNGDLELSYYGNLEIYKEESYPVKDIENWGKENTTFFKGEEEEMTGPDHNGEPKYEIIPWNYKSFDELPFECKVDLITQFLKNK